MNYLNPESQNKLEQKKKIQPDPKKVKITKGITRFKNIFLHFSASATTKSLPFF